MIKKLTLLLLLVIAITSAGYFYIKQKVDGYLHQAVAIHSSEIITIPSGTSLNGVLTILSEKKLDCRLTAEQVSQKTTS